MNDTLAKFIYCLILAHMIACTDNQPYQQITHDSRGLYHAALSNDGSHVLIASVEKSAQLWKFASNQKLFTWKHHKDKDSNLSKVSISGNKTVAATIDNKTIGIWDPTSGKSRGYLKLPSFPLDLNLSFDGNYALISYANRSVQLIDLRYNASAWQVQHSGYIESIALSNDARLVAVANDDDTITIWDVKTNQRKYLINEPHKINFMAISPNNQWLITSSPFQPIKVWSIANGKLHTTLEQLPKLLRYFSHPMIHVSSASFSADSKYLLTGAPPRHIYLWDLHESKLKQKFIIPKLTHWKPTAAIVYATAINLEENMIYAEVSNGYGYNWKVNLD